MNRFRKAFQSDFLTEHLGDPGRIQFQSTVDGRNNLPTGDVQGQVSVAGRNIGRVGVFPTDDDPYSTDYVRFDTTGLGTGEKPVKVNGQRAGSIDIEPQSKQEQSDQLTGGTTATPAEDDDQQQQESNMALGINPDDNLVGGGSISATGLMSGNDNNSSTGFSTTLIAVVIGLIVLVVGMGDM